MRSILRPSRLLTLGALLLALAGPAAASTYYVATSGSDSNPGTSDAPFYTIQQAVNSTGPGDTVIVRDGVYSFSGAQDSMAVTIGNAGTAAAWITLQAEHPGYAILDCAATCHSYINLGPGAAYWIIRGFDIRNGRWSGIFSNSGGGQNILIQRNVIHNIGNRPDYSSIGITGIYTDNGAVNFQVDANTFHDIGRTDGQDGRHDHSIYTKGNLSITNNVFYNLINGWHIQTAHGFSGTIAGNTFFGADPVSGTVGQIMLWDVETNVTVRDNIFYGGNSVAITTYALQVQGSCTVDHNLVYTSGASMQLADTLPGCSASANLMNVDPKLVRPSVPNYDFHLLPGSPAIGAGAPVYGMNTDSDGLPRPSPAGWDEGAYQYPAGTPGAPAPGPGPGPGTGAPIVGVQSPYAFRAPQKFLSPATADGINDEAIFGPMAKQVTVFDTQGRPVFQALRSGNTPIVWTGRDASGRIVSSGAYIVQIVKDDGTIAYQSIAIVK